MAKCISCSNEATIAGRCMHCHSLISNNSSSSSGGGSSSVDLSGFILLGLVFGAIWLFGKVKIWWDAL